VHLLTEGNGLPLAFLLSAANVAEVRVGLEVVEQVRVPRPQGRPKQRPASLAADRSYDSAESGLDCGASQVVLPKSMRAARVGGRWSGVMAGWTTGADWWCAMISIPNPILPF